MLHWALKQAVRWGLVARNVSEQVDPPRQATPETRTWDVREVAAVLNAAAGDELKTLWRLALLTAMRRRDLLGVKSRDLDLDRGTVAVRRTLSRGTGGTWELGTPTIATATACSKSNGGWP